jgi:hypothetical protein
MKDQAAIQPRRMQLLPRARVPAGAPSQGAACGKRLQPKKAYGPRM